MDKLEVSPQSVRGYGNIIIPKLSTDFVGKYNEIYTDEDGYFVLAYGGVMLKASATVSNTIKGIQASLTVLVSTRDSDTPVSGLSVDCSVDDVALTGQTTDSTGKCTFTWTPSTLGDSSLLISISPQDDYAGLSLDKTVTVGLLLGFDGIMTSLSLEDDEVYSGTFEEQVEDRSQLTEFVKDVWVASGGEPIVDEYGIIHICEAGDLVVESEGLEQLPEYSNVLFEEDVDLLTGAVYDMAINEDYEIVLDCLERDDIVPPEPTVSVVLTSSESSISIGDSVIFTATCTLGGEPVTSETVSFYDWDNLVGSSETDSDGVATYTASSLSAGFHTVSAVCEDTESNRVSVYAYKLTPSISLSVPATGTVGTAYTVSGTLVPTSGTVYLSTDSDVVSLTVSDGVFSKSFTKESSGTYRYLATFFGDSEYEYIQSDLVTIVVSDAPPVPSYDGITLISDESILSYADGDTCTLTAQLTDDGSPVSVEGVTVEFFKGSTSLGTADTNSSGVATKTYASAGSGDVSFTAEADSIISSEIYVEDCMFYDDCSTDNLSSYIQNLNNGTVSYTDHSYYIARTSSSISNFNQLQVPVTGLTGNVEFSVEMKLSAITGNTNGGIWLADKLITSSSNHQSMNGYGLEQYSSNKGLIKYTNGSSSNVSRTTPNINTNEWYEFKFKIDNGQLTSTITSVTGESVVFTNSTSYSYSFSILFLLSNWKDTNSYYRNIKVKPV